MKAPNITRGRGWRKTVAALLGAMFVVTGTAAATQASPEPSDIVVEEPTATPVEPETQTTGKPETATEQNTAEPKPTAEAEETPATASLMNTPHSNPQIEMCGGGLDIALALDQSKEMNDGHVKTAAKHFVDSLSGTDSSIAMYAFSNPGNSGRELQSTPINANNMRQIYRAIDSYKTLGNHSNWDLGLWQVAEADQDYDLTIVITGKNPNDHGHGPGNSGNGNSTPTTAIETAVHSANALKDTGSRIIAIGAGGSVSPANLQAISGPTSYGPASSLRATDYAHVGWDELGKFMKSLAGELNCQTTLEVTTTTQKYGQDAPENGGPGWEFAVDADAVTVSPESHQTTEDDGTVKYSLAFDSQHETEVTIESLLTQEQDDAGWQVEQVACEVESQQNASNTAVTLTVAAGDTMECTFHLFQALEPSIEIEIQGWDTPTAEGLDTATTFEPGDAEVASGQVITWTYEVTNIGETVLNNIEVVDDKLGNTLIECPSDTLQAKESMSCTASGEVTADL